MAEALLELPGEAVGTKHGVMAGLGTKGQSLRGSGLSRDTAGAGLWVQHRPALAAGDKDTVCTHGPAGDGPVPCSGWDSGWDVLSHPSQAGMGVLSCLRAGVIPIHGPSAPGAKGHIAAHGQGTGHDSFLPEGFPAAQWG